MGSHRVFLDRSIPVGKTLHSHIEKTLLESCSVVVPTEAEWEYVCWASELSWPLSVRTFVCVTLGRPLPDFGKKVAGILRDKPNIKWSKDRGKDVASAPLVPYL